MEPTEDQPDDWCSRRASCTGSGRRNRVEDRPDDDLTESERAQAVLPQWSRLGVGRMTLFFSQYRFVASWPQWSPHRIGRMNSNQASANGNISLPQWSRPRDGPPDDAGAMGMWQIMPLP
jgi:hypothetical protein